jgi:hypothetical protein
MKICALLMPREMKLEHTNPIKELSDEELEAAIEALRTMIDAQAADSAKVIQGMAETVALPTPVVVPAAKVKRPNKLVVAADTAVGPRERKPKRKVPAPCT